MKRYLILIWLAATITQAAAREIVLAWDANPTTDQVEEYRVYELVPTGWTLLGSTTDLRWEIGDRQPGRYEFAVTAVNYWGESARSESVSTAPGLPAPPPKPHIEGARQVAMEVSGDLETWKQVTVVDTVGDREFWRVRFREDQ